MKRNAILFLTYWYPSKNNKSFGIFVKRHAHALKLNHELVVLSVNIVKGKSLFKKSIRVFEDEQSTQTHEIMLESRFNKILYLSLPLQYLIIKKYVKRQLLPQNSFSAVHSNIIFPCGIIGSRLAGWLGVKHLITEHWTKIDKFFRVSLYKKAGKTAYNRAAAITVVSEQLADTLRKYTTNPRLSVVPNVVDSADFFYDPSIPKNEIYTFIAAAHWDQHKNPFYFLEALKELHQENQLGKIQVVLAGRGSQLDKIRENKYPFHIDYKGSLSPQALNLEFNKSHMFLHGSDFETFSVIIAEALMSGLPSVVSPVGIAPETIRAHNGFMAGNTIADWKEKIKACMNTSYDRTAIAIDLKDKYSLRSVAERFENIYQKSGQ